MCNTDEVRSVVQFYRELGLVSQDEVAGLDWLLATEGPYATHIAAADSVHTHIKVADTADLPRERILASGAHAESEKDGYVKFAHPGGINFIFSSIPVSEDERLPQAVTQPRPFLDHAGIDLRRETSAVRELFDALPAFGASLGWRHVAQGGEGKPVYCCHTEVGAKHWLYPPQAAAPWNRPLEFAFGPLQLHGNAMGCDLRPIDPAHSPAEAARCCASACGNSDAHTELPEAKPASRSYYGPADLRRLNVRIEPFFHGDTNTWSYVVAHRGAAAIIDPVLDFDAASGKIAMTSLQRILDVIAKEDFSVEWILETHAHADHLSASAFLQRALRKNGHRAMSAIGRGIVEVQKHFREVFGIADEVPADGSQFDRLLDDGDRLSLGDLAIDVLATPGHTSDGLSYRIADAVFVGDTVFSPHAGTARCDFPGGDAVALFHSIRRLYALPDDTRLFLCHDYPAPGESPRCEIPLSEMRTANRHVRGDTTEADYVALRTQRDATLAVPRLLLPSLQINIRGGELPAADEHGRVFLKWPLTVVAN
jgi:glyoxylase-like metal-dependent hydrolase (beta-lactamase superfamily II)